MQWRVQTVGIPTETKGNYVGNRDRGLGDLLRAYNHCIVGIVLR